MYPPSVIGNIELLALAALGTETAAHPFRCSGRVGRCFAAVVAAAVAVRRIVCPQALRSLAL